MANDRNAGRKPKFPDAEMTIIRRDVPVKLKPKIGKEFDEIVDKYAKQYKDYDWT